MMAASIKNKESIHVINRPTQNTVIFFIYSSIFSTQ